MRIPVPKPLKQVLSAAALCLAAAYTALLPQFYLVYQSGNRYTLDWSPRARAGIWIAIGILAAAYLLAYGLLRLAAAGLDRLQARVNARRLVFDAGLWALYALALRAVLEIAGSSEDLPAALIRFLDHDALEWGLYLLLPVGLLAAFRRKTERVLLALGRLLAILFALFIVQLFTWPFHTSPETAMETAAADPDDPAPNNLYLFLFDCWSYPETFGSEAFDLDQMPNLKALLNEATLYHDAYSPGIETTVSVPRFLYQPDPRLRDMSYRDIVDAMNGNRFPGADFESIFDLSDRHYKFIAGSILHYADFVGDRVDSIVPFYAPDAQFFLKERVVTLLRPELGFLDDLGIPTPFAEEQAQSLHDWGRNTLLQHQVRIRPVLNDALSRLPSGTIAFFHMMLPHPPFGFTRDWTPRPDPFRPDPDGRCFLENVYAADAVIGDIVRHLRARGEYDDALLVILSDHAQRDGDQDSWEKRDAVEFSADMHTPLIIKHPGQTRGGDVHRRIVTTDLHPLFRDYLNEPEKVREWTAQWNAGTAANPAYPLD